MRMLERSFSLEAAHIVLSYKTTLAEGFENFIIVIS